MAVAAIDRLVHHANILEMGGESYRMKASMQRQGGKKSPTAISGQPVKVVDVQQRPLAS